MDINKQEIQNFINLSKKLNANFDKLYAIIGVDTESELFDTMFKMHDNYMAMVSDKVGDDFDSLGWYVYENEYGEKAMEAGVKDDMRKIKTIDDLMWLMEVSNG